MNWEVRFKNWVFWVQVLAGAAATVLAYAGITASDLTTWASVGNLILATVKNPYCLFLIALNVWSAINDPTTKGLKDSKTALSYTAPKEE